MKRKRIRGGIDAGGTTFKCGVMDDSGALIHTRRVQVTTPDDTVLRCLEFFAPFRQSHDLLSFGIGSFGPVDINPKSASYGTILDTPKPGWANTNLVKPFESRLGLPVRVDTDVNAALVAERELGAARMASSAAYITIGTGIGAAIYLNGAFVGLPTHPEFGHISVRRHSDDKNFASVCPFHDDCLEGLASGTAMEKRAGNPRRAARDHAAWVVLADYLAQACRTLYLTCRVDRVLLGGGLMQAPHLLQMVKESFFTQLSGYTGTDKMFVHDFIRHPELSDNAGLIGAILVGHQD